MQRGKAPSTVILEQLDNNTELGIRDMVKACCAVCIPTRLSAYPYSSYIYTLAREKKFALRGCGCGLICACLLYVAVLVSNRNMPCCVEGFTEYSLQTSVSAMLRIIKRASHLRS